MNEDQAPVTKQDLKEALADVVQQLLPQMKAMIDAKIDASAQSILTAVHAEITEVRAEIVAAEQRSQEFTRNVETSLLKAFQSYAAGHAARMNTWETTARDLALRVNFLEERVLNLETRRPQP